MARSGLATCEPSLFRCANWSLMTKSRVSGKHFSDRENTPRIFAKLAEVQTHRDREIRA